MSEVSADVFIYFDNAELKEKFESVIQDKSSPFKAGHEEVKVQNYNFDVVSTVNFWCGGHELDKHLNKWLKQYEPSLVLVDYFSDESQKKYALKCGKRFAYKKALKEMGALSKKIEQGIIFSTAGHRKIKKYIADNDVDYYLSFQGYTPIDLLINHEDEEKFDIIEDLMLEGVIKPDFMHKVSRSSGVAIYQPFIHYVFFLFWGRPSLKQFLKTKPNLNLLDSYVSPADVEKFLKSHPDKKAKFDKDKHMRFVPELNLLENRGNSLMNNVIKYRNNGEKGDCLEQLELLIKEADIINVVEPYTGRTPLLQILKIYCSNYESKDHWLTYSQDVWFEKAIIPFIDIGADVNIVDNEGFGVEYYLEGWPEVVSQYVLRKKQ